MGKSVNQLIDQFNIKVSTKFMKEWQQLETELKMLAFSFPSGYTKETSFPISQFLKGMKRITDGIEYQNPADTFQFSVKNYEYGNGVSIPLADFQRAGASENLMALNPYELQIKSMVNEAKEFPFEEALAWIEAGAASTYGTTFDGQTLYSNTHDWSDAAGSQDNLLAGTGVTFAKVYDDLLTAYSALEGFYFVPSGDTANEKKKKLNKNLSMGSLMCVVPSQLAGIFLQIQTQTMVTTAVGNIDNIFKGLKYVTRPFTDANDWYIFDTNDDGAGMRPVLISMEEMLKLDNPAPTDDDWKKKKRLNWGLYDRHGLGYGAWWKTAKIVNA